MTPARIELHIDTLVLHGLDGTDPAAVGAAVQRELARLLAAGAVPAAWQLGRRVDQVDGGTLTLRPRMSPEAVGGEVARTLHQHLTGSSQPRGGAS